MLAWIDKTVILPVKINILLNSAWGHGRGTGMQNAPEVDEGVILVALPQVNYSLDFFATRADACEYAYTMHAIATNDFTTDSKTLESIHSFPKTIDNRQGTNDWLLLTDKCVKKPDIKW